MSQVKKYQKGTTDGGIQPLADPNPKVKFQINGEDYNADPQSIKDMFNPVFESMKAAGVAKERNREEFFNTFQQFNKQASSGTYNINSSDGKYLNSTYHGADGANLGMNDDGTTAHKSSIGNIVSPFSRDEHQRMAMMNTYLGDHLIQNYSKDKAATKAKTDADVAKALSDKNSSRDEFLGKYADFQNPNTAIYGRTQGSDPSWALSDYWKGKQGQGDILKGTFSKIGSYLFDKQLDDADVGKAFKEKYGQSVEDARSAFTKHGFANGQFADPNLTMQGLSSLAQDLQVKRNYDGYFERGTAGQTPEQIAAGKQLQDQQAQQLALKKQQDDLKQDGSLYSNDGYKTAYLDRGLKTPFSGTWKDGTIYDKGKLFTGVSFNGDPDDDAAYESKPGDVSKSPYVWMGKRQNYSTFWNGVKGGLANKSITDEDVKTWQTAQQKLIQGRDDRFSQMDDLKDFDKNNSSDYYIFNKELQSGKPIPRAQSLTGSFPDLVKKGERLVAYQVPGQTNIGTNNLVRYRHVDSKGHMTDGVLNKDVTGRYYIADAHGKHIDLGNFIAKPTVVENPYYMTNNDASSMIPTSNPSSATFRNMRDHKEGGVIKAQMGAKLADTSKNNGFKSAGQGQVFSDFGGLSTADKVELGGIAAQIGSVITGFIPVPGASIGSAVLGVGGTAAEFTANRMKGKTSLGSDLITAGGGLLLDAASALPGVGELASTAKLAKLVKGAATTLKAGFIAHGAVTALSSLSKVISGEDVNIDDWRNIAGGIQGLVAGKRMADPYIATTKNVSNMIRVNGVNEEIPSTIASQIQNAKPSERLDLAKSLLKDKFDVDKLDLSTGTTKSFLNKYTLGKFGKSTDYQQPQVTLQNNGRQMIDFENANWLQRGAIKNVAATRPGTKGAENFVLNSDGDRASDVQNPALNWIANSYKMKYAPAVKPVNLATATAPAEGATDLSAVPPVYSAPDAKVGDRQIGVKFAKGGKIPKYQYSGIFQKYSTPDTPDSLSLNGNDDEDSNFLTGRMSGILPSTPTATPSITNSTISPTAIAALKAQPASWIKPANGIGDSNGSSRFEGNKGFSLSGLMPKNVNVNALSELGRALYTRQLNSQIDTRVERPMLSAPAEVATPVHGNLYATTVANQQANDLIRNTGQMNSSDNMLRTGAMLGAYGKAAQIRQQGEAQNIDTLEKTRAMSLQQQTQAAGARSQVANENVQTLARATQAERAAQNDKFGRMNQPLVDFWKDQNYRGDVQRQQDRQYDTQIGLQNKQTEFQNIVRPMYSQMNSLQMRAQQLEYKSQTGQMSAPEQSEYENINKQLNDMNLKYQDYQNKFGTLSLLTRKNYGNYATPSGYYGSTVSYAAGGAVAAMINSKAKVAIEESKENEINAKETAEAQRLTIKSDADNEAKANESNSRNIQQLIMKALS